MLLSPVALAAIPEDFSCRGVYLGTAEAEMLKVFGEPMFDKDKNVYGQKVKYYEYKDDITVGVSGGKVVDFLIKNEKYEARDGIRYGATAYYIRKVFGEKERTMLDGTVYYIYDNPANGRERLLIESADDEGTLKSMRITSLPLTDEEADEFAIEDWETDELGDALFAEKEIDTSALPEDKPAVLKGPNK